MLYSKLVVIILLNYNIHIRHIREESIYLHKYCLKIVCFAAGKKEIFLSVLQRNLQL